MCPRGSGLALTYLEVIPHQAEIAKLKLALLLGGRSQGPAVVEQPDATVLIEPGFFTHVDEDLNLIMEVKT